MRVPGLRSHWGGGEPWSDDGPKRSVPGPIQSREGGGTRWPVIYKSERHFLPTNSHFWPALVQRLLWAASKPQFLPTSVTPIPGETTTCINRGWTDKEIQHHWRWRRPSAHRGWTIGVITRDWSCNTTGNAVIAAQQCTPFVSESHCRNKKHHKV